ncbi:MAG: hypothetical protein NWE78_06570 [Candidatus Bathyarchaeota archaeon]|nr:hypothetical protein [Candidatus Bathyarchaeota archaeon]
MASEMKLDKGGNLKKLAELKRLLEEKIETAKTDLNNLTILLDFVNETLLEKGFKKAQISKPKPPEELAKSSAKATESMVPLKTAGGDLIAQLLIREDSMHVTIPSDKTFSIRTPPFQQFLVERVLNKMQEKDYEETRRGKLASDRVFTYRLELDNDEIRGIDINNITPERSRELKSSIRWTLEKMYEKTNVPS